MDMECVKLMGIFFISLIAGGAIGVFTIGYLFKT